MEMTQLNRVILRGTIGNVRFMDIDGRKAARATIATNCITKDRGGNPVIETLWSDLFIIESPKTRDIGLLARGKAAEVTGRLRKNRFTDSGGEEKSIVDVVVSELKILGDISLEYQPPKE